ncbi:MAG: hypothetical protein ACF8MJ_01690 [Phycisphaerales bacterium JB050]
MPRIAIASLLTLCGTTLAAPFVPEPLIKSGDHLDALTIPEVFRIIHHPTINSHGEWAVSVSSGQGTSLDYSSVVLGNDGVRIPAHTLPSGESTPDYPSFGDVDLNDSGQLAVAITYLAADRLGEIHVDGQLAGLSLTGNRNMEAVRINNAGYVQAEDEGFTGNFHWASQRDSNGNWQQGDIYLGRNVQTPVGLVVNDILSIGRSAVGPDGTLAYSGVFEYEDANGEFIRKRAVARGASFVARVGEPVTFGDYQYSSVGATVQINSAGELAFHAAFTDGASPPQGGGAIVLAGGTPLITSLDQIADLEAFENWTVSPRDFSLSDSLDVLWMATSDVAVSPDVPEFFGSAAIMLNDRLLMKTGDLMPDGALLYDFASWELSANGQWAIVSARAEIPGVTGLGTAVYRIQVPSPGPITVLVCLGATAKRRLRRGFHAGAGVPASG